MDCISCFLFYVHSCLVITSIKLCSKNSLLDFFPNRTLYSNSINIMSYKSQSYLYNPVLSIILILFLTTDNQFLQNFPLCKNPFSTSWQWELPKFEQEKCLGIVKPRVYIISPSPQIGLFSFCTPSIYCLFMESCWNTFVYSCFLILWTYFIYKKVKCSCMYKFLFILLSLSILWIY